MHVIDTAAALARALDSPLPPPVRRLLSLRRDLIGGDALLLIAERGDTLSAIEAAAGLPVATSLVDGSRHGDPDFTPSFEWALDHGGVFELSFILTDDGFATVLVVPDLDGVDPTLLALAREHAEPADPIGGGAGDRDRPAAP